MAPAVTDPVLVALRHLLATADYMAMREISRNIYSCMNVFQPRCTCFQHVSKIIGKTLPLLRQCDNKSATKVLIDSPSQRKLLHT